MQLELLEVGRDRKMERETGFEPATSTLARSHSTTELFPLGGTSIIPRSGGVHEATGRAARRILDWPEGVWYDAVFVVPQHLHPIGAVAKW